MQATCIVPPAAAGLLTAREAAKWLGVCERHLWSLTASGEIAHVRVGRRSVRYLLSDLQQYAESRRQGGTDG